MERNKRKEIVVEVFKRLKTKNNRLKGGEKIIMKKFLSVLITVTMIFSLVAAFRAPTAEAFPTTNAITLTTSNYVSKYLTSKLSGAKDDPKVDPYWIFNYFSRRDANLPANKLNNADLGTAGMTYEVYKMGDAIYGYVTGLDTTKSWQAILAAKDDLDKDGDLNFNEYYVVDTLKQVAGINKFVLNSGNVEVDGEYLIFIYYGFNYWPGDYLNLADTNLFGTPEVVYITYNMTIVNSMFDTCSSYYTLTGYLTRGNGQTVLANNVRVDVNYPDGTDAVAYWVQPYGSGMFTITFPADNPFDADTDPDIGRFYVYVLDGYNGYNAGYNFGEPDTNDYIAYYYISNIPTISMNLSTYISPIRIYKSQTDQPILLHLVNQDGDPVTGLLQTDWITSGFTISGYSEISAGFYRFEIDVTSSVDVRFRAVYSFYSTTVQSNQIIINTIDKTIFNPYVDITAPDAIPPYGQGPWILDSVESVYDKLPCTIGNSFNIMVDSWSYSSPDWSVYDASWEITGPIELMWEESGDGDDCTFALGDEWKVLITQKGKISVTVNMTAWERVDKTCDIASTNACCHEFTKTFDICEVNSCTYGGVTLSGTNIIDSTTVEVGKKVDKFSVSIDSTGAPTDLVCSCPNYIVVMYMTQFDGQRYSLLPNAFTVDTWAGYSVKGSMIWYNPQGATGPNIPDQPIQTFMPTGIYSSTGGLVDTGLKFGDCPFNLYGITFNYPTGTPCGYQLVVKVIGLERSFDACGNMNVTYPMIAEDLYPITVTPSVTTLTSTHTITEGTVDPDQMLVGVPAIIDITNPGFSYDKGDTTNWKSVSWKYYFNGTLLDSYSYCHTYVEYGLTVNYSTTDTGYRFVLSKPFSSAGTFKIVGTSYNYNCTKKETVTIEIEVLMPEFTVKIGLNDCDHTVIPNDGILTEGIDELIYVTVVDPRGIHDFSTDPNWTLSVSARNDACGLATSKACGIVEGPGCSYGLPIRVVGYDNPNLAADPKVRLYFNSFGAKAKITDFMLVPPTITVDPKEVPFSIPATTTHVTFTVKDAHGYPVSGITVEVVNTGAFGVSSSGYSWSATAGTTGCKGEVDWGFIPPYSGKYKIRAVATPKITCVLPCGWYGINTTATLEAVYKAPVIDTTAPVVTATAPAKVTTSMVKVTGKATDNVGVASVWIGAKKADLAPDGAFEAIIELVEGANTVKVVAYDAAGNKGEATVTVTYEVKKVTVVKLTIGQDIMTVNGNAVQLDAAPEIVNGRTFLPLRAIAEIFGATVEWIPDTQGVTVTLGDNTIGLQIGNPTAVINGNVVDIVAPYIKNGRTMVPLRVIAEGLGATVEWDPVYRIVTITM